ncbi:4-Cys prefix domain-containing protein [Alkalinema pantanalense CENA528]|uniref:4-Cys prefix domain-containing protein n=1 Tax=Alkalinema pantanalense TaxID=1620705 RepID=UPI003D6F4B7F
MSRFDLKIYCTNPHCDRPDNVVGAKACANCGMPITYRRLWAMDGGSKPVGSIVGNGRYQVVAPQIWLDLQPGMLPYLPQELPETVLPYLHLYPYRLHVPNAYGFCREGGKEILLLDNCPIDAEGTPYLTLVQAFGQASAVRQVYWLWQMWELWQPLLVWQVGSSLLVEENLRVQDWRLRLRALTIDATPPSLSQLAEFWSGLLPECRPTILPVVQDICVQLHDEDVDPDAIRHQLNQLLLQQAAPLSLGLQVYGTTDVGKERDHNEDTCYPLGESSQIQDELLPRWSIVCDGIGGHEGGEVASHLAVQSVKPQIKALLAEIAEQQDLVPPEVICEQLAAIVRVANNLISAQNDNQERQDRRRMGTTLVMALQVPQRVKLASGAIASNSHELYITNVGDSRAYWLTPRGLHCLTVDDDVAAREVRLGRTTYRDALQRPDAGALIQALGTRDSEFLKPTVSRFVVEEDGVLLLCSDGLSDRSLLEQSWENFADPLIRGRITLEAAAQAWIQLANERNGSDNISLVLTRFQVGSTGANAFLKTPGGAIDDSIDDRTEEPITDAPVPDLTLSEPTIDTDAASSTEIRDRPTPRRRRWIWGILLFLLLATGGGLYAWSILDANGFNTWRDRVQTKGQEWLPK